MPPLPSTRKAGVERLVRKLRARINSSGLWSIPSHVPSWTLGILSPADSRVCRWACGVTNRTCTPPGRGRIEIRRALRPRRGADAARRVVGPAAGRGARAGARRGAAAGRAEPRQPVGPDPGRPRDQADGGACGSWRAPASGGCPCWARSSTGWGRSRSGAERATPARSSARSRRSPRARRSACSPRAGSRGESACGPAAASDAWRQWCPGVQVVLCAVEGTTSYARWPRRPRVRVTFFRPAAGDPQPGEEAPVLAARLLDEIRDRVEPVPAGRRARVGGPPRVQKRRSYWFSSFPILKILVPQSGHVP